MDIAYCDTETTSLRNPHLFGGRRMWEVAIIRVSEFSGVPVVEGVEVPRIRATWLQIVDVDLADADSESLAIGRFHKRWRRGGGARYDAEPVTIDGEVIRQVEWNEDRTLMAEIEEPRQLRLRGVTEDEAAAEIEELTRGAVIAGSNPGFDIENFAELLYRHGLPSDGWYHHPRDVPDIASGWLLGRQQLRGVPEPDTLKEGEFRDFADWTGASYSTGALSEACGVPVPADRHSAWADAAWMWRWDRVLRGLDTPSASLGTRPNGPASRILRG